MAGLATGVFGALLIAATWVDTVVRVRTETAEATASELQKNENLALALDVQTTQLIRGIDQLLLIVKNQYEGPGPRIPIQRLVPRTIAEDQKFTFIGVADARGDIIESAQGFTPANVADREMFRTHEASDTGRLLITPPVLGRMSGRWAITMSRRINRPDGSFFGVAAASIEPEYLTELFETATLGPNDVMSLVLESGITLARRRGTSLEFGADISRSPMFVARANDPTGAFVGPGGVDGHVRMFSYRTMAAYPVVVTVGTSEVDAMAPVRRRARTYYLNATLASLFIAAAMIAGLVVIARQRRFTRLLHEQASLLDKAQDAIVVCDLDGRVSFWNLSAERLYGWTAEEAVGRRLADLLYAAAATAVERAHAQVLETGEWSGELHPQGKGHTEVVADSRWTLVRDESGRPLRILTLDTDVTARRQLEQQFYRAQRLESIGTLAGGIAHDLNNVLTPITLAVEVLQDRVVDPVSREVLATLGKSARRGAEMVRQVLSFARGQEGTRVEMRAGDLIADVERIARDSLPKNVEIQTRVAPGLPPMLGDPTQFHQVLLNLCVNARDAMPEGGRLTLDADLATLGPADGDVAPGVYVRLGVEDTGTGIAPDILDKIFDPFFTTKGHAHGTGLGLSTSLTIVRNHGGHMRVESEPGRGTRFRIYVPAAPSAATPPSLAAPRPLPRGRGQTVLVIDDEAPIRLVVQHMLEGANYQVLTAADGADGVALFARRHEAIAAVVVDMMMPVLGGVETIRALARIDPRVPVIAASGIVANEAAARDAGPQVRRFLSKPFTAEALLSALADVLAPPPAS